MRPVLEVEIWSDVVCPWCYIGKRRFERAVAEVADEIEVRAVYRPYQLDPTAPAGAPTPVVESYAKKFGGPERAEQIIQHVTTIAAGEGIEFRMDRALRANTLLAHRLLLLAELAVVQAELKQRLLEAYFTDGLDIGDPEVLADRAAEVGLDRDRVVAFLAGDEGLAEVQQLLQVAHQDGITAVPTFVLSTGETGSQGWMVPGAQETDTFVKVFRRLVERAQTPDA